jgi:hypothetical protein
VANTYAPLVAGTPLVWTTSGGDKVITGTSLANAAARQGDKSATLVDASSPAKGLPAFLEIVVETKVQSAPTDGLTVDLFLGFSNNATAGTNNPAGLTGADGTLASPASVTPQLTFVGSIICSNAIGTGIQRQDSMFVAPKDAYVIPVLVNSSGQTISATGTDTKITITPWYQQSS